MVTAKCRGISNIQQSGENAEAYEEEQIVGYKLIYYTSQLTFLVKWLNFDYSRKFLFFFLEC